MSYRNSQKRDYTENNIYFIVAKTDNNYPYFKEPIFCELLIEELKICKKLKKFKLYGFSIIYDHLNLIIHPSDKFNVSKIMFSIKKQFSHNANKIMGYDKFLHNEGEQTFVRLRERENDKNNLINDHYKIIYNFQNQFIQKYERNQTQFPKFKWQKSYHDHIIRNRKDFENHCHYTIYNFQKHNLPNNWKYTSLNYEEMIDEIEL